MKVTTPRHPRRSALVDRLGTVVFVTGMVVLLLDLGWVTVTATGVTGSILALGSLRVAPPVSYALDGDILSITSGHGVRSVGLRSMGRVRTDHVRYGRSRIVLEDNAGRRVELPVEQDIVPILRAVDERLREHRAHFSPAARLAFDEIVPLDEVEE